MNFSQRLTLELVFFIGKCEDWHFTIKQKSNIRGLSRNFRLCWSSFSVCSTRFCIIPIYIYFTVCWNECVWKVETSLFTPYFYMFVYTLMHVNVEENVVLIGSLFWIGLILIELELGTVLRGWVCVISVIFFFCKCKISLYSLLRLDLY